MSVLLEVSPGVIGTGRGVGLVGLVDQRVGDAGDRAQLDGGDVVEHPATIGESGRVAADEAQVARVRPTSEAMAMFSRSMSACTAPVKFWKPGTMPAGMPVSRIAARSARGLARGVQLGQVREHARVEHGQQPGQFGLGHVRRELLVLGRRLGVEHVLLTRTG